MSDSTFTPLQPRAAIIQRLIGLAFAPLDDDEKVLITFDATQRALRGPETPPTYPPFELRVGAANVLLREFEDWRNSDPVRTNA